VLFPVRGSCYESEEFIRMDDEFKKLLPHS